jgi:hypothetical protein
MFLWAQIVSQEQVSTEAVCLGTSRFMSTKRVTRRRATHQTQKRVWLHREDLLVERDAASGDRDRKF